MLDTNLAWVRAGVFRTDVTPVTEKDIKDLLYLRVLEDWCIFEIEYTETVNHRLNGSTESDIRTSVFDHYCTDRYSFKQILLRLRSDFEVEHWEEYLDYGYVDWFVGMGGLVTFMISVFLFVAGKMWIALSEKESTGILRLISGLHKLKEIVWDLAAMSAATSYPRDNL